jgi:hypothetical protein
MLSNRTITFLNQYCDVSDKMFTQGGANYIFKFGRKLAHCMQEKDDIHMKYSNELSQTHLNQLQTFLDTAHDGMYNDLPSEEARKVCSSLINLLQSDINYDFVYIIDYFLNDYISELKIVMIKDNDYYSLELMWQLD